MEKRILVTYDSKHGATAEIAEKIDAVLKDKGLRTKLVSLDTPVDPAPFESVVLGTAVYIGQWRKNAVKFLKEYQAALAAKKCWIFATGPTGEGDAKELMAGWEYPPKMKNTLEAIAPEELMIFHGAIDMEKLNKLEQMTIKMVKAETGDFRDWKAIEAWALKIAGQLGPN